MKQLIISNAKQVIMELQEEIRRSKDARYDHRLHAILLVAQGISSPEVARLLGDGTRTVQMWIHRFEDEGFQGLMDKHRPGRPPQLKEERLSEIGRALRSAPEEYGLNGYLWDGKTLSAFIEQQYGVQLLQKILSHE